MCGIAGVFLKHGKSVDDGLLKALSNAMAHRGPDGEGTFKHGRVGLVHRRLSIIDVAGGAQPLTAKNGDVQLIANGEVYNYKDLQAQVKEQGNALATGSDCEPLGHLYAKYGFDAFNMLQGMFAIALYDKNEDRLILARDPFGIKPLYIAQTTLGIAFASEPAVLTRSGWVRPEVNWGQVPAYLNRQYVTGKETLFKGVERVMPGEMIIIEHGDIKTRKQLPRPFDASMECDDVETAFEAHFQKAVELHLQSDVPYGAFLSGGIDSSAMVTQMSNIKPPVRTFTIGFESETVADERSDASHLSELLKTNHTNVNFSEDDFWDYLPRMCVAMDDLVADYAALPLLKLSEQADVKVILSGEGGDEIFAGYSRYREKWYRKLLGTRKNFRGAGEIAKFKTLFTDDIYAWQEHQKPIRTKGLSRLQQSQLVDIESWLPDDLLTKVDRCLMTYGKEGRVPYLDFAFSRFGFFLDNSWKVSGKHGKWILKNWLHTMLGTLNDAKADRVWAKKKGFSVPIHDWMEKKRPDIMTYLDGHRALSKVVTADGLDAFMAKPFTKQGAKMAFSLLCFTMWYDVHVLGKNVDAIFAKKHK